MFKSIGNWFLNTFVRISPVTKTIIFLALTLLALWFLKTAFAKSNAKGGDKLKDWSIGYFIAFAVCITLAILLSVL